MNRKGSSVLWNAFLLVAAGLQLLSVEGISPRISRTPACVPGFVGTASSPVVSSGFTTRMFTDMGSGARTLRSRTHRTSMMAFAPGFVEDIMYNAQSSASSIASSIFDNVGVGGDNMMGPGRLSLLYFAGLLTGFSPCSLGLLPLTLSYISTAAGERTDKSSLYPTVAFAGGLAMVFCGLGLSVSLLGGVFGRGSDSAIGNLVLVAFSSGISIAMGLQLLELVNLPLPSIELDLPGLEKDDSSKMDMIGDGSILEFDDEGNLVPPPEKAFGEPSDEEGVSQNTDGNSLFRAFLLGGSLALVASPCATPVLTSILAFVAASQDPVVGFVLLMTYTVGYTTPLLVAAATGGEALAKIQAAAAEAEIQADGSLRPKSLMARLGAGVTPLTACILIYYGTSGLLTGILGDPSLAGLAPVLE